MLWSGAHAGGGKSVEDDDPPGAGVVEGLCVVALPVQPDGQVVERQRQIAQGGDGPRRQAALPESAAGRPMAAPKGTEHQVEPFGRA